MRAAGVRVALLSAIIPTMLCSSLLQPCLALQVLQVLLCDHVHRRPAARDVLLLNNLGCGVYALFLHPCPSLQCQIGL